MRKKSLVVRISRRWPWLAWSAILLGCTTTAPTAGDPSVPVAQSPVNMDSLCQGAGSLAAGDSNGIATGASRLKSCLERMAGSWETDPNEVTDLEKALDSAVAIYPASVKNAVRARLQAVAKVPKRLDLSIAWPKISMGTDGGSGIPSRPDKVAAPFEEGGEEIWLATRWEENRMIQAFQASDGSREDAYGLSSDGRKLVLVATTRGEGMVRPLVVTTVFRRR